MPTCPFLEVNEFMTQIDQQPQASATPDSVESAKAAGLRYVTDTGPGIRRKRSGKGFRYIGIKGDPVHDPAALKRIQCDVERIVSAK